MIEHTLWVEKYRPHQVQDTILPAELKAIFQGYVDKGHVDNMILAGRAGIGKTTIAKAMLDEIGADYIVINASLSGNIDTLRTDIQQFASSVSFTGGRKYVILDEADYLTNATQPALRSFIEEFSINCGFILTCNNKQRIIEALHSRCPIVEFKIPKAERATLAKQFYSRITEILTTEKVEFDKSALIELIQKFFPDWRRIIGELQRYSASGKIDAGILTDTSDAAIKDVLKLVKAKSFTGMRKMLAENPDLDFSKFYRQMYDSAYEHFAPEYVPQLVMTIGSSMDEMSRSLDPEITLAKFLTEVMMEAVWK